MSSHALLCAVKTSCKHVFICVHSQCMSNLLKRKRRHERWRARSETGAGHQRWCRSNSCWGGAQCHPPRRRRTTARLSNDRSCFSSSVGGGGGGLGGGRSLAVWPQDPRLVSRCVRGGW